MLAESMLKHIIRYVLENAPAEMAFFNQFVRRMAGGIGIFRPEGGTEGIYIFKGKRIGLQIELPADGQIGGRLRF